MKKSSWNSLSTITIVVGFAGMTFFEETSMFRALVILLLFQIFKELQHKNRILEESNNGRNKS